MAKKKKLMDWVNVIVGLAIAFAVGGLFTTGTTLAYPILGFVPEIVHTVIGWVIIIGAIVKEVQGFM